MQHTMVIACVTVISEPLGKLTNWLVRWLACEAHLADLMRAYPEGPPVVKAEP